MPPVPTLAAIEDHRRGIQAILARPEVLLTYLYGSVAVGRAWAESDLDVALLLSSEVPAGQHWGVSADVAGALSELLHFPGVEVRLLNGAPLHARYEVVRHGKCLYAREESLRVSFEARVTMEYLDFLPVIRQHDRAVLRRAREKRYGFCEQRSQRNVAAALRDAGGS